MLGLMERQPSPEKPRRQLHVNLLEEGRSIYAVIGMAEGVLAESLFDELDKISQQIIQGDEVADWSGFHQAATDMALLKKDIIDTVGRDSISRRHDEVLGVINRHVELVDTSGAFPEYGAEMPQEGVS